MKLEARPAADLSIAELCDLLNAGFVDYVLPITLSTEHLLSMIISDAIDLRTSRVLVIDGERCGVGLIARRGRQSRLAAMSLVPTARGRGAGKWLVKELLNDAQTRGESSMFLEVIEQNLVAVKLYEGAGFQKIGRLVGFQGSSLLGESADLEEVEIRDVVLELLAFGTEDLPWQCSAESMVQSALPNRAFRLGPAWAIISDPSLAEIRIRTIVVEPDSRREGAARRLLLALFDRFGGKTWKVPIVFPESVAPSLFESVGMQAEAISQFHMKINLGEY